MILSAPSPKATHPVAAQLRRSIAFCLSVAICALAACSSSNNEITSPINPIPQSPADTAAPPIQREMRGVWIATVANIDWPTRTNLTAAQQQGELRDLLDRAKTARFNAIMFHVRPASDAVYRSSLEPWASMLTGAQGIDPGYDPLAFAVAEAHARGLELHAWINPFRAGNSKDSTSLAPLHLFRSRRELVRVYGTQLWLDPGEPAVHDHVMQVVADIVRRYDIDGVHADDYFYPYQQHDASGKIIDFPDSASYAKSGSSLLRADWRRQNVDRFVERMYREIHSIKPDIKVGISPFGIWRPGFPAGVNGLDAYATIYADSRKWLQQGWVDYLSPQLYWAMGAPQQSFQALLDWWTSQSSLSRPVWPGLAAYRVADGTASAFSAGEIPGQVSITRQKGRGGGYILYNASSTLRSGNGMVATSLFPYQSVQALVPASPWLDAVAPPAPLLSVSGREARFAAANAEWPRWWVVRTRTFAVWQTQVLFGDVRAFTVPLATDRILLNAVDQAGNMSEATRWIVQ